MNYETEKIEHIRSNYRLDCIVINNGIIQAEYFSSPFATHITHYFLSLFSGIEQKNAIIHLDHFTRYLLLENRVNKKIYIFGPFLSKTISTLAQNGYLEKFHIRKKDIAAACLYMKQLKKLTFNESVILFQELYPLFNNIPVSEEQIDFVNINKIMSKQVDNTFQSLSHKINEIERDTQSDSVYIHETTVCNYIKSGDPDGLFNFLSKDKISIYRGLCDNLITDLRNMSISAIALASHYAIIGGLSIQQSFRIMDLYIYLLSEEEDVDTLLSLTTSALIRFAKNVSDNRFKDSVPPIIKSAVSYIKTNVTKPITVKQIANILNINQTYMSKLFKKHMGTSVSSYITAQRVEKAKEMLPLTNVSLAAISEELCFSSQPHFQSTFKKYTGMTPLEYRNLYTPH